MLRLINRVATVVIVLAATGTLVMTAFFVATNGGVDVLGLQSHSGIVPTPISVGPTPIPGAVVQPVPRITSAAPLNSVIVKRPLFQDIPVPQEISRRPEVVGTNIVIAILLALALGVISTVLNDLVRKHENTFANWLNKLQLGGVIRTINRGSHLAVRRGCLGLPIIMLIFALYGIIFAFLEKGTNLFSPDGIQLALVMAMSVGLISLGGDIAQRLVGQFWRSTARYGLYPANLLIAVGTTFLSRTLNLTPGIVFGVPGGADVEMQGEGRNLREVVLAFTTLATVIVLGGLGWAATGAIAQAGATVVTPQTLEFAGPLMRLAQTLGLAIFAVAVQTAFFEMWPLSSTLGSRLFKWNGIVWAITFVPVVFIFAHTMLNPNSDFLSAFRSSNLVTLMLVVIVLMAITFGLWIYFALTGQRNRPLAQAPSLFNGGMDQTVQGLRVPRDGDPMMATHPHLQRPDLGQSAVSTQETLIPRQARPGDMTLVHDTQPLKPVTIDEPPVSPHDTKPRPVDPIPVKKPIRKSRYPDPSDPYAGLFPPPAPGDEDYLESEFNEEHTPPAGMPAADVNQVAEAASDAPTLEEIEARADAPTESQVVSDEGEAPADHPAQEPPDSLPL